MNDVFIEMGRGWLYALAVYLVCMAGLACYLYVWSRIPTKEEHEKKEETL